jgi:hypothetical protein
MVLSLRGGIDRTDHGTRLFEARAGDHKRLRGQGRLVEQGFMASFLAHPVRAMRAGEGEVFAAGAGRRFAAHGIGIGPQGIAETSAIFPAIDTVAPIAYTLDETGFGEHACVGFQILLHARAAKARPFG